MICIVSLFLSYLIPFEYTTSDSQKESITSSSSWITETIDISNLSSRMSQPRYDSNGTLHFLIIDQDQNLKFLTRYESSFSFEIVDEGCEGFFWEFDKNDQPHITYLKQNETDEMVMYAFRTNGEWSSEYVCPLDYREAFSSMTLDRLGRPHIVITNGHWCELKYGIRKDSGWDIEIVYKGSDYTNHRTGRYSDITIDNDLTPHIVFSEFLGEYGAGTIYYATYEDSDWVLKIIVSDSETNNPSIALDSNGNPHFSYVNTEYQIEYVKYENDTFKKEVVFKDVDIKYRSRIEIDSKDRPRILFCCYEMDEAGLFLSEWDGEAWETEKVYSKSCPGITLFIDLDDESHIIGSRGTSVIIAKRGLPSQCSISTPPRDLEVNDKEGYIKLTWNRSFSNGYSEIIGYNIYRSVGSDDFQKLIFHDRNSNFEYFDSEIESNRTYRYYISAVNAIGESNESNIGKITVSFGQNPYWEFNLVKQLSSYNYIGAKIFIDRYGRPNICYSENDPPSLMLAAKNGAKWTYNVLKSDYHSLIALDHVFDNNGDSHYAYVIKEKMNDTYKLIHAWGDPGNLSEDIVDNVHMELKTLEIRFDSKNQIHMMYYDSIENHNHLIYATQNGSGWTFKDLGYVGHHPGGFSFAIDKLDRVHLCNITTLLTYSLFTNDGRSFEILNKSDSYPPSFSSPKIMVDSNNNPYILYKNNGLKYGENIKGNWSFSSLGSLDISYGVYDCLFDENDTLHILYYDMNTGSFYGYMNGSNLTKQSLNLEPGTYSRSTMILDPLNRPHIIISEFHKHYLIYTWWNDGRIIEYPEPDEINDNDGDGLPDGDSNNSQSWMDMDDDNDGYSDIVELEWNTDPLDNNSHPLSPVWLEIPTVEFGGCEFGISFDLLDYISDVDTPIEKMIFSVMGYNATCINVSVSGHVLNIDQITRSQSEVWLRAFDGLHYVDTNITVIADGTGAPLPDHDKDGIPDAEDDDIDNDGFNNTVEGLCGTNPYNNRSFPPDLDEDGLPDSLDPDRDGDGVDDEDDPYPDDCGKWEEEVNDKKGNSVWWWVVGIVFLLVVIGIVVRLLLVRRKGKGGESEKKVGEK